MKKENIQDFDLGDIGTFDLDINLDAFAGIDVCDDLEQNRYIKPLVRAVPSAHVIYEHAEELARATDISSGTRYDCVVSGNFIFGDYLEALLVNNGERGANVVINTLSISQNNIDSLEGLLRQGYIDTLTLVLSAYFYSTERRGHIPYIYEHLDIDDRFQLAVAGTHMKTITIATSDGRHIVIHGSANMRSSGNIEQFTIEENAELFRFYNGITDKIVARYSTIQKPIRRSELYKTIKAERR